MAIKCIYHISLTAPNMDHPDLKKIEKKLVQVMSEINAECELQLYSEMETYFNYTGPDKTDEGLYIPTFIIVQDQMIDGYHPVYATVIHEVSGHYAFRYIEAMDVMRVYNGKPKLSTQNYAMYYMPNIRLMNDAINQPDAVEAFKQAGYFHDYDAALDALYEQRKRISHIENGKIPASAFRLGIIGCVSPNSNF